MRFDVNNSQGTPMQDAVQMSLGEVHSAAEAALLGQGFNRAHAAAIANTVTAAEQDECRHHGLFRLPFYMNGLHSGQASPDAEPTIKELAPGIMKVDAKYGFSPLALERGDEPLAAKAKDHGIAALAVNNALNVAALWPKVERLAGPLLGDALSFEAGERDKGNTGAPCGGELIIAIDPVRCVENGNRIAQLEHGEMLFKKMLEQDGARLPSDRRYEARKRTAVEGVKVPRSLYESIQAYIAGKRIKERNAYEGDHLTHKKEAGHNTHAF